MSVGRPRWTWRSTCSIACWTWDARAMSASPDPDGVGGSAAAALIRAPRCKKRMETMDDETSAAAIDFMQRQVRANTPFLCWYNSTRMHFRTHVRPEHRDKPGL